MAEQYSVQAETLMKAAVEEYEEILKDVKATDANLTIIRNIRVSISGKPRRLVDIADLRKTDDPHLLELLVFNTDHVDDLSEQIDEAGFKFEIDGQFIKINVPDPTYKQLMEVVDDLNRKRILQWGDLQKLNLKLPQGLELLLKMNLLHKVLPVQPLENVMNITKITEIK